MEYKELELKNQVDFKLIRLNKPKFNYTGTPLFGEYISNYLNIDSNSDDSILSKEHLLKSYNLTEVLPSSNVMMISSNFGKILFGEVLDACVFIINTSQTDDIKIREIKVVVTNDALPNYSSVFKKCEFCIFEATDLFIPCGQFYANKVSFTADNICRYTISSFIQYSCNHFNEEYLRQAQGRVIKTMTDSYYIDQSKGVVTKKFTKKMVFENNLPFKIKEKIVCTNLGTIYLEINLVNNSNYTLHIVDYVLTINRNSLENFSSSKENNMVFFNNLIKPFSEPEEFSLEPEDEYNMLYKIEDHNLLQHIENFSFKVNWVNIFDSTPKQLVFIIKNKSINDIVKLSLFEINEKKFDEEKQLGHDDEKAERTLEIKKGEIFTLKMKMANVHKSKLFLFFRGGFS